MKRFMKLFFVFLILFSSFPFNLEATSNKYGIIRSDIGIFVRDGAGTNYNSLGDGIADNRIVTIYEAVASDSESDSCPSKLWYKIKYLQVESGVGYVCSDFVEVLDLEIDDEFEAVLLTFPESYRENLRLLHVVYPNASFVAYNVDLDFNEVVNNQKTLGKSLIWDSNNSRDGLKHLDSYNYKTNTFNNNYPGGGVNWFAASEETIAYYVDPRNFLDETRIFMFESLSYNSMYHSKEGIEAILKTSFMYDSYVDGLEEKKFSDVIMASSISYGISPYYIASRILQETGTGRSALVLGTYPEFPEFNGYYNFYNYGATGNEIVKNGLTYAFNQGWNSEEKAIDGGASLIGTNYIAVGQDTNYFQKWDVICKSKYSNKWDECGYYKHQYMQNIEAPYSESLHTYNGYKNTFGEEMHNVAYVFTIPVYKNMPEETTLPNSVNPINYLSRLVVNNVAVANFDSLTFDYSIVIPSSMKIITIEADSIVKGANISGIGSIEIKENKQVIPITVTALNGSKQTYNITVNLSDDAAMTMDETIANIKTGVIFDSYISGLTNVDTIKNSISLANSSAFVEVRNTDGVIVNDGSVGTGYKIKITVGEEVKEFQVIVPGEINGDTEINVLDIIKIQRHILKMETLIGPNELAANLNDDTEINVLDIIKIQRHMLGIEYIN